MLSFSGKEFQSSRLMVSTKTSR